MPEDKAAINQTRLEAGEFFVMAEVPGDRIGEFQLLLKNAGGEEIHTIEKMARSCSRQCNSPTDLSFEVRAHLSDEAQSTFVEPYNAVFKEKSDEIAAEQAAWETIHQQYDQDENGVWSKAKVKA